MSLDLPGSDQTFRIPQLHLATALSQVSLGFWEVNLSEGNYMVCTDQCKRNFGWPTDQPFGYEDLLKRVVPEDLMQMQAAVAKAISGHVPYFSQYRVKLPDGSLRWIEAQGSVIYAGNEAQQIIGTTVDITKAKDLEILRDELLSVAMHELKTPLSAVKGSLQLLERFVKNGGNEKISDIVSRAMGSADRINRLLAEMARPLRAQAQEITLDKKPLDLCRLATEVAENAEMLCEGSCVKVHRLEPLMIDADRLRIGQVMTNLVNNAIKYSPGHPQVDIFLNEVPGAVEVRISDKGIGIPPEERHRVFRKFYRADNRTAVEGLGIGLFLCSEIVLRHGGTIAVEDSDEPGTVVRFRLPV